MTGAAACGVDRGATACRSSSAGVHALVTDGSVEAIVGRRLALNGDDGGRSSVPLRFEPAEVPVPADRYRVVDVEVDPPTVPR